MYDHDYLEELNDYDFSYLKPEDVVLNIGAGAGLYALLAASVCKHVYVIEPLFVDVLTKNIDSSKFKHKLTLLPYAFGKDGKTICEYRGRTREVESKSLQTILCELDPSPTFVKCDCEGCEFDGFLLCNDFKDVRFIEMEYHTNSKQELLRLLSHLTQHGFSVKLREKLSVKEFKYIGIIHASRG